MVLIATPAFTGALAGQKRELRRSLPRQEPCVLHCTGGRAGILAADHFYGMKIPLGLASPGSRGRGGQLTHRSYSIGLAAAGARSRVVSQLRRFGPLRTEGTAVVVGASILVMDIATMAVPRPITFRKGQVGRGFAGQVARAFQLECWDTRFTGAANLDGMKCLARRLRCGSVTHFCVDS
jgi:hypothetical protein